MKFGKLCFIVCMLHAAFASHSYEVLQGRTKTPSGWKIIKEASDEIATFRIHLRQCNLDVLEEKFWQVSDPDSIHYGKYMTVEEITSLVSCDGDVEQVQAWLRKFGITNAQVISNSIKATAPVSLLEKMLATSFHHFEHRQTGARFIRQMGPVHVPSHLVDVIEFIGGISDFFVDTKFEPISARTRSPLPRASYNPNSFLNFSDPLVNPLVLRQKYDIPLDAMAMNPNNGLGIAAFMNAYDEGALCSFHQMFSLRNTGSTSWQGPFTGEDQVESDLDVQYATAIALGINSVFDNHPPGEWILDWAQDTLQNSANGPWVWSISYGWPEMYQCSSVDNQTITNCPTGYDYTMYIKATDTELMKLGLRGITVAVASGDDGTPGFAPNCPLDPKAAYAAGSSCHEVFADDNCQCGEMLISAKIAGQTYTCFFPNGLFTLDEDCYAIFGEGLDNGVCTTAIEAFVQNYNHEGDKSCNNSFSMGQKSWFFSNCSCSSLDAVTESTGDVTCTVEGYYYDPSNGPAFLPDYPAASPYVTAVGAVTSQWNLDRCDPTTFLDEVYCEGDEAAAFGGGGGFSSVNPMPAYQMAAVSKYLQNATMPPASTFVSTNRAYPDVSVNGHNFIVVAGISGIEEGILPFDGLHGAFMTVSGTSASSPTFAGMIALINDWLLSNNRPTLGFLNPLLYKLAAEKPNVFNDIVPQKQMVFGFPHEEGSSTRCTSKYCCQFGFPITEGYDAGTGLGTPNFYNLMNAIQSMQAKK